MKTKVSVSMSPSVLIGSVRHIVGDDATPEQAQIILVCEGNCISDETARARPQELDALRKDLADLFVWNTTQYKHSKVFMHT